MADPERASMRGTKDDACPAAKGYSRGSGPASSLRIERRRRVGCSRVFLAPAYERDRAKGINRDVLSLEQGRVVANHDLQHGLVPSGARFPLRTCAWYRTASRLYALPGAGTVPDIRRRPQPKTMAASVDPQHLGPADFPLLELTVRLVRLLEPELLDGGLDRYPRGQVQELTHIPARDIGHALDLFLVPEVQRVVQAGEILLVDLFLPDGRARK